MLRELKLNLSGKLQTKNQLLTPHLSKSDEVSCSIQKLALTEIRDEIAEAFVVREHLPELLNAVAGAQLNSQTPASLRQTFDGLLDRLLTASGCSLKSRQGVGEVQPEKGNNRILIKVRRPSSQ